MSISLYHNIICGIKACYPIRDKPIKLQHPKIPIDIKVTENDITELKRIFDGGITHADCYLCKEAHDQGR